MNAQDYPLALSYKDIMEIMRVSRDKAYECMRRKDFPKIRDGRRIIVPRDAFFKWFNETAVAQAK